MSTLFAPLLASQTVGAGRLWILSLILAVGGPPAFAWLRQRHWRFTVRSVFIVFLIASASIAWVASDLANLVWLLRDPYATLVDFEYRLPLLLVVTSTLVTWSICRTRPEHSGP